jgi:hypothetical protein
MILEKLRDNLWRFHPGDDVYIAEREQQLGLVAGVVARERDVQIQPAYGVIAP